MEAKNKATGWRFPRAPSDRTGTWFVSIEITERLISVQLKAS